MAIAYDSYVSPAELTAFVRAVPTDQQYILNQILPDRVDEVLEAEFSEVTFNARVAKARAFDAPPMPGRRDQFSTSRVKLPAVSQMLGRGERDRLELERFRSGGQSTSAIVNAIYDDAQNNAQAVLRRVEVMRGDLLADGKVTFPEMGNLEADFGVPGTHIVSAATAWTDHANADILGNLRAWNQVYRLSNGFNFGGMVISEDRLYDMLQNEDIRALWSGIGGSAAVVTLDQLNQTLQANRLPPVLFTYDAQVVDDTDTPVNILPNDKVIFVPPAGLELGFTQWGMTATALELQNSGVQVQPTPAGMVGVVDKDVRPPYRESAYVDATCMPVLSRPKGLFVADVAA